MPSEVDAANAALNAARAVAKEQGSPAFISVEAGDYEVAEVDFSTFSGSGRPLCKVNPDGSIDWEHWPPPT